MGKTRRGEKWMLFAFLLVPFISSILSTIHIISLVRLGNANFMAIALAVTYELGSVTGFITITSNVLNKIKKSWVMVIFVLLFILQAFGNLYSTFAYTTEQMKADPHWLDTLMEMTFNSFDVTTLKFILAAALGVVIPFISLIFLKSAVDYFYNPDEKEIPAGDTKEEKTEPVVIKEIEKPLVKDPEPVVEKVEEVSDMIPTEENTTQESPQTDDKKKEEIRSLIQENQEVESAEEESVPGDEEQDVDNKFDKALKDLNDLKGRVSNKHTKSKPQKKVQDAPPKSDIKFEIITDSGVVDVTSKKNTSLPFQSKA